MSSALDELLEEYRRLRRRGEEELTEEISKRLEELKEMLEKLKSE